MGVEFCLCVRLFWVCGLLWFFFSYCVISDLPRIKSTITLWQPQENTFLPSPKPEFVVASFLQRLRWLSTLAQNVLGPNSVPFPSYCSCTDRGHPEHLWRLFPDLVVSALSGQWWWLSCMVSISFQFVEHTANIFSWLGSLVEMNGNFAKEEDVAKKLHSLKCQGNSHCLSAYSVGFCYRKHQLVLALSFDNIINIW